MSEQERLRDLTESLCEECEIPPTQPTGGAQFDRLPLSFAQERLWFLNELEPGSAVYNVPGAVSIRGALDVRHVERALNFVIARHESLRTVFPSEEGRPYQRILDRVDFKLERIDLSHFETREGRGNEAKELCRADAARPFDLANGPLLRGKVIRLSEHEHILMLNMHHIISDGWSHGVLLKELGVIVEAYRQGREPELAPLPIQYADYSVWQRRWLEEGGILARQLRYWQEKLAGVPEGLDLATDYPRPAVQSLAGASHELVLDRHLSRELKRLAEQQGATLYMVLLAAFNTLLYRYTGQNEICVGSPIANRQYGETEGLIGVFINTLAMHSQVDGNDSFMTLLSQVKVTCLEAYEHQDAPFEKVVDLVSPQRNLATSTLFQVMLILQNTERVATDASIRPYPLDSGTSKFDLTFDLMDTEDGLVGSIRYSTALYKAQTIERMARHFTAMCRAITATPTARINALDYLSESEKQQLLVSNNDTAVDYGEHRPFHQLFAEQVARHPDKTAVVCGDQSLSYQELYDKSRDLASCLRSMGVGPDRLVGLCTYRSLELIVGILGILQAGGAYVPLDADYPTERLRYMLEDAAPAVVLTQERLKGTLPETSAPTIALDSEWNAIEEHARTNPHIDPAGAGPHNLAYVIYTSGSTGQPKGVMVEHGNLSNYLRWVVGRCYGTEGDGSPAIYSIGFDGGITTLFGPLVAGQTLRLVPHGSEIEFLAESCSSGTSVYTLMKATPSHLKLLNQMIPADANRTPAAALMLGGEALIPSDVAFWQRRFPEVRLINQFGPTETTVACCAFEIAEPVDEARSIPIGRPIANTRIYILDSHRQPVPVGVPGELYVSGAGVARGYLNRPDLTEEKFVPDPFSSDPKARMYRTGDRGRWLPEGVIEFLGRIDTQVKIRGFRIEVGEIEARLEQHPEIRDCVVVAQGEGASKRLIAFYQAKETTADQIVELPNEDLRGQLLRMLPDYMVPAAFVSLAAIPLNRSGKADRRALARMDVTIQSGREYVAPRNDTERRVVAIWSEVLKRAPETIGVKDNFFELGGHSLLATQLISKIRNQLGIELPLKVLFERANVGQLAESIATARKSEIPPIRPLDRTQFDHLPLSFAQERLWFLNQLAPNTAGYNIPLAVMIRGALDVARVEEAFNFIIARHENLRTVFPSHEGQAEQKILDAVDFKLARIDLSGHDREVADAEAKRLCQSEATTPFDLATGPLLRGMVIKLAEDDHILMLNLHHIISDAWSHTVLVRELGAVMAALREGRRPELSPLPIQYADYSVWQRRWLAESGVLDRQLGYWQQKLAGIPESLDLATDHPRPGVQSSAGARQAFALDAQLTGRLKRIAEQHRGTLYMVLLAAFNVLLHRYTGQDDVCVGSPIANRQYGETEGLIGMFANTLALRTRVDGGESFAALLEEVKTTCVEAYEHQDAPFERVVDAVRPQRNMAISPIFQVALVLQNVEMGTPDAGIQQYPLETGISKFDLTFEFIEIEDGLAGSIEYCTALYEPATIARMAGHFTALCQAIAAAPTAEIRALDYLGEAEKHRLLIDFNATQTEYPKDRCLPDLFAEQVARNPERTAVVCGGEQLTYQELLSRSRDLALYLQSEGVRPDSLVGVCMERSLEMVVALYGILQAGGAYVPLDPDYPDERLDHMVRDSRAAIVLTQERLREKLATLAAAETRLIALDAQWPKIGERVDALKAANVALQREVEPPHLAYVIYTSGSTGRPKGVMNEHRGVVNRLLWMQDAYGLGEEDAVLQKTPYSFDVSVWEFFWPLLTGATLVMARPEGHKDPAYLADIIRQHHVTTLHFVPSMLQVFLEHAEVSQCLSLRRVICSGEALPSALVRRFAERLPQATLYNLYGPTEAAVDVTAWTCPTAEIPNAIPIGRPIANTQIYILDPYGAPVPVGVAGELCIGGVQVARGYLNRPELTAERFVTDPFAAEAGARMYKTGDLARWQDDGNIEYLGRNDFQIKLRGFRIELGEIEARLTEHEGVREAVVVAREVTPGEKHLVAYYTPSPERAFPVAQFLRLRKTEAGAAAGHCTLPNGVTVFHQNQSETDFVYDEIFQDDGYLKHGVTLNDGDCVFDVGANIGLFSLFVAQRCRNATIYGFEPIPPVFTTLQLNSRLHGWNGKFYECGLAETSRQHVFAFYPHNTVISSGSTSQSEAREIVKSYLMTQQGVTNSEVVDELLEARLEAEEYTCQLRTVSEIIDENHIERIDLLKIDVEKGELDVLKGIDENDWTKIRQLVIEVHDVSGRLVEIAGMLTARGYEAYYEQSRSLESTQLYNLYARRPAEVDSTSNGNEVGRQTVAERVWSSPEVLWRDVRAFLSERLPEYMVPAVYVPLDEMPLSPNGKLDRKVLPAPEAGSAAIRAYEPPRGEVEEALAAIWQELLHVERVGRNDNFFELGGHSLAAVPLMAKTARQFGKVLPLSSLFTAPNIAAMAKLISSDKASSFDILVPIQPHGDAPPIFAVPGAGGNVLSLRPLSRNLGDQQPFFAFQAVGLDGKTPPHGSVEQTAQANIAAMKTVQPSGPYRLVGHSYGGVVAYEMARILLEQGEEISSLTLVDSLAPSLMRGHRLQDEIAALVEACQTVADVDGAKLEIDLEKLRQSTFEERVRYLAGLLRDRGLAISSEQFAVSYRVYWTNLLCYHAYTPSSLPRTVDVSLYRAKQGRSGRQRLPRDYGWDELFQSPINTSDVDADHFSILTRVPIRQAGEAVHASVANGN